LNLINLLSQLFMIRPASLPIFRDKRPQVVKPVPDMLEP
jgi:hypothetical protein